MPQRGIRVCLLILLLTYLLPLGLGAAAPKEKLTKNQLVYVPVYSYVYYGDQEKQIPMTAVLCIRNLDPNRAVTFTKVDYYDSQGQPVRSYLTKPLILKPLASTRFIIGESDHRGGFGASFLVHWQAEAKVNPPLLEGVMIGASGQLGISFTSRGVTIQE